MENEITKNTGFLFKEQSPTDFKFGAETGIDDATYNRSKNWEEYLPEPERQKGKLIDTMACVTYSALNSIETQFDIVKEYLSAEQLTQLIDLGYIVDGELSLSDRFTAKMSGTTKEGNYFVNVWDSIRKHGVLPEKDWPSDPGDFTWDEYYKEIPQKLKDKALKFLDIFTVMYEWIDVTKKNKKLVFRDLLRTAPIQVAVKVGKNWSKKKVLEPEAIGFNHAVLLYSIADSIKIYDHYVEFKKRLVLEYPVICAIRGVLSVKKPTQKYRTKFAFGSDLVYKTRSEGVERLQKCLIELGYMSNKIIPTGYYGDITADAVYRFQVEHNVSDMQELDRLQGRIVGVKTRARLNRLFAE